jgi:hypothetical protein
MVQVTMPYLYSGLHGYGEGLLSFFISVIDFKYLISSKYLNYYMPNILVKRNQRIDQLKPYFQYLLSKLLVKVLNPRTLSSCGHRGKSKGLK